MNDFIWLWRHFAGLQWAGQVIRFPAQDLARHNVLGARRKLRPPMK